MKLARRLDKIMLLVTVFLVSAVMGAMVAREIHQTAFAENESGVYEASEEHFVTFYDEGSKLTVKTAAATVREALARAGIEVNEKDLVDPGMETAIDGNNFFINIHRARPVVVRDGVDERYVMTASYDPRTIAREAGLTVYDGDEIREVANTRFLEAGVAEMYAVTRNGGHLVTVEEEIPFETVEVKDYSMTPGTREVRQLGEVGVKVLTYEVMYVDDREVSRTLMSEEETRAPVARIVAVGASEIERTPLTATRGAQIYTVRVNGRIIERKETYYDLDMSLVMKNAARMCGVAPTYSVREDGVKVDADGYVLVAAELSRYPRCSVVETSLGLGKVYDTGSFAATNPEQFDLATDWTNRDGR